MIAVDTNLLVYAHRPEMPFHAEAAALISRLAVGTERWAIPWPCAHEFIAVVTNPRIYKAPTSLGEAFQAVQALNACSNVDFIGEAEGYLDQLEATAVPARIHGGAIHDARIAAICRFHGIRELWSADRDFTRFPQVQARNPLLPARS